MEDGFDGLGGDLVFYLMENRELDPFLHIIVDFRTRRRRHPDRSISVSIHLLYVSMEKGAAMGHTSDSRQSQSDFDARMTHLETSMHEVQQEVTELRQEMRSGFERIEGQMSRWYDSIRGLFSGGCFSGQKHTRSRSSSPS